VRYRTLVGASCHAEMPEAQYEPTRKHHVPARDIGAIERIDRANCIALTIEHSELARHRSSWTILRWRRCIDQTTRQPHWPAFVEERMH
jgi:hypothetical protein